MFELRGSNKDAYQREVERVGCTRYEPCPICFKCKVKASHLYRQCANCSVPVDRHTEKDRAFMIRRENFAITVEGEVADAFRELGKKAEAAGWLDDHKATQSEDSPVGTEIYFDVVPAPSDVCTCGEEEKGDADAPSVDA